MKVLVACEESQEVCKAFRELGHEAYPEDAVRHWAIGKMLCDAADAGLRDK